MDHKEKCAVCGTRFQFSNHQYDGKKCQGYNMMVCRSCYNGNHDGWALHHEERILEHLEEYGIEEPDRLENGLLPREF